MPHRAAMVMSLALTAAGPHVPAAPPSPPGEHSKFPTPSAHPVQTARVVTYDPERIVSLRAKVHGLTIIRLPEHERVVDVTCPDKDLWIVNGHDHDVYVKPTVAGSHTDLGILTASDTLYAFVLQEVTNVPGAERDFIVKVETSEAFPAGHAASVPKYVPATQMEDYRQQLELAREDATRAKAQAQASLQQSLANYRASYPLSLHFGYRYSPNAKPFLVRAMFDDGQFTYIQTAAHELPALYEVRDGTPALVQFEVRNGTYIVHKLLDRGYLAIGKQRLNFVRVED